MPESPTARTLRYLRQRGASAAVVERFMKPPGVKFGWRVDLFNFGDLIAILDGKIWIIQVTTTDHVPDRMAKVAGIPESKLWADTGNPVEVWGWAKRGPRGKIKRWKLIRFRLESLADLEGINYRWTDDLSPLLLPGRRKTA